MYKFEPGEKVIREFIDKNGYPAKFKAEVISREDFHTAEEECRSWGIAVMPKEWGSYFKPFSRYKIKPDGFYGLTLNVNEHELSKIIP